MTQTTRVKRAKTQFQSDVGGGEAAANQVAGASGPVNICRADNYAGLLSLEHLDSGKVVHRRDGKKLAALLAMTA